ncbi:Glycosyltransferase involved in cell wall bisynthesis [Bacillus sp. OV166]|uniref:glycosyltransferase family 4 protein n=1 Tax=Bacillus sp. OV166 TaxID=1882763 RepID=UPI000A2AB507|nr:glycosyltransferase family 4 protein [Bacillus sp. OV166]SMQ81262.1 Glycosyltransferase involved in cell wall bisynthesis [Bacillus sp. OV166]
MKQLVFISTGWGSKHGGINSFNYDLCLHTAKLLEGYFEIVCVVQDPEFDSSSISLPENLFLIKSYEGEESERIIRNIKSETRFGEPFIWIGHDVKTGQIAIECANKTGKEGVVFHHMNYSAYSTYQSGDARRTQKKIELQKSILTNADYILAIGPSLHRSAKFLLQKAKKPLTNCFEIIPGLSTIDPIEPPIPEFLQAVAYGRLDDDIIKQGMVAIGAFAQSAKDSSAAFYMIGVTDKDTYDKKYKEIYEDLQKFCSNYSDKTSINIQPLPYLERTEVFEELRVSSASMMLSLHEGFGLAGWEAISAEVPLILSTNTGLYELLKRDYSHLLTCVHPVNITGNQETDVNNVSAKLDIIFSDIESNKKLSRTLKEAVRHYTWERTCKSFLVACNINCSEPITAEKNKLIKLKTDLSNFIDEVKEITNEINRISASLSPEQMNQWKEREQSWQKAKIGEFIEEDSKMNISELTIIRRQHFLKKRDINIGKVRNFDWLLKNHNNEVHGAIPKLFKNKSDKLFAPPFLTFDKLEQILGSKNPEVISPWLVYYILYLNLFEFPEELLTEPTITEDDFFSKTFLENESKNKIYEWLKFKLLSSLPTYIPVYEEMSNYLDTRIESLDTFFNI